MTITLATASTRRIAAACRPTGSPCARILAGATSCTQPTTASAWSARRLVVLSRRDGARREIALDFMPDNIHRLQDGTLLVAGQRTTVEVIRSCTGPQCPQPWVIVRVDPPSGQVLPLLEQEG